MDPNRFDEATSRLTDHLSRRGLGGLAALGLGAGLAAPEVEAKRKKKKRCPTCPTCPTPPAPPFCAGKNECAQLPLRPCATGATPSDCRCFVRADTSAPFCGLNAGTTAATTCEGCPAGKVCVVAGGACGGNFLCAPPCPNPQ